MAASAGLGSDNEIGWSLLSESERPRSAVWGGLHPLSRSRAETGHSRGLGHVGAVGRCYG